MFWSFFFGFFGPKITTQSTSQTHNFLHIFFCIFFDQKMFIFIYFVVCLFDFFASFAFDKGKSSKNFPFLCVIYKFPIPFFLFVAARFSPLRTICFFPASIFLCHSLILYSCSLNQKIENRFAYEIRMLNFFGQKKRKRSKKWYIFSLDKFFLFSSSFRFTSAKRQFPSPSKRKIVFFMECQ